MLLQSCPGSPDHDSYVPYVWRCLVFLFLLRVFASLIGHVLLCLPPVFHMLLLSLVSLLMPLSLLPVVSCCSLPTCVWFSHWIYFCGFKPSCFPSSLTVCGYLVFVSMLARCAVPRCQLRVLVLI